jgi:hypothetical protein
MNKKLVCEIRTWKYGASGRVPVWELRRLVRSGISLEAIGLFILVHHIEKEAFEMEEITKRGCNDASPLIKELQDKMLFIPEGEFDNE